jgi:hypothetical protein
MKQHSYIPGRRTSGREVRLGRKVFAYFTHEEGERVEAAAKKRRRSISSYVAEATLKEVEKDIGPDKKSS